MRQSLAVKMLYREPSDKEKRKIKLKPSYKAWIVDNLLAEIINECSINLIGDGPWRFCAEQFSKKYKAKPKIVSAAIQKFKLHIPKGYCLKTINSAPHESSRHRFFYHGPNKSGWQATVYIVDKIFEKE